MYLSWLHFPARRQMHILLTPHSQQNLADSTGYLVPQAWQNLLLVAPFPTSYAPSTSFLRNVGKNLPQSEVTDHKLKHHAAMGTVMFGL